MISSHFPISLAGIKFGAHICVNCGLRNGYCAYLVYLLLLHSGAIVLCVDPFTLL